MPTSKLPVDRILVPWLKATLHLLQTWDSRSHPAIQEAEKQIGSILDNIDSIKQETTLRFRQYVAEKQTQPQKSTAEPNIGRTLTVEDVNALLPILEKHFGKEISKLTFVD